MNPFERGWNGGLLTEAERRSRSGVVWPQGSMASDAVYPLLHEINPQPSGREVYPFAANDTHRSASPGSFPITQANGVTGVSDWLGGTGQQGLTEAERKSQQRPWLAMTEGRSAEGIPLWPQGSRASDAVYPLWAELCPEPPSDVVYPLLHELNPEPSSDVVYPFLPNTPMQPPFAEMIMQPDGVAVPRCWLTVKGGVDTSQKKEQLLGLIQENRKKVFYFGEQHKTDVDVFPINVNDSLPKTDNEFGVQEGYKPNLLGVFESVEGSGIAKPIPAPAFQSIRSWLIYFFANSPRVKQSISWKSISTPRDWDPSRYDVSDDVSVRHEAWQEFFYYFWIIEQLYEYYGLIRNNISSFNPYRNHPPTLDLPFWITNEERTVDEIYARRYYLAYLAHSFVLEKHRLVPWSLRDYTYSSVNNLLFLLGSDNFCKIEFNQYGVPYFSMRVSPSDPTVLFLWMVHQGWINPNHPKSWKMENIKRTELRDHILRWCGSMITHTAVSPLYAERTPGYPLLRKTNGQQYNSVDYFFNAYWGSPRIPPMIRMISGYCMDYQSIFYMKDGTRHWFEEPPEPMVDSAPYPLKTFLVRAR